MSTHLYFAFGSNLNPEQMARRCPESRPVVGAVLPRNRIGFAGMSQSWGGGVATIRKDTSSSVPGLLYSITRRDMRRLDGFEGHPWAYRRERVVVDINDAVRGNVSALAWTYRKDGYGSAPSDEYLGIISEGYKMLGDVATSSHYETLRAASMPNRIRRAPAARPRVKVMPRHCEMPFLFADEVVETLVRHDCDDEADRFQTDIIMRDIEGNLDALIDEANGYVDVDDWYDTAMYQ